MSCSCIRAILNTTLLTDVLLMLGSVILVEGIGGSATSANTTHGSPGQAGHGVINLP